MIKKNTKIFLHRKLFAIAIVLLSLNATAKDSIKFSQQDLKLWYNKPAGNTWENALPIGAGTNFAKYGNPNGKDVPKWPAFTAANPKVMYLGPTPHIGTVPGAESLKVLDTYFKWRRTPEGKAWAN